MDNRRARRDRLLRGTASLSLQLAFDRGFKLVCRNRLFDIGRCGGALITAKLGEITNGRAFASHHNVPARFIIMLDVKAAVTDSDKGNELIIVVLDKKNVLIADLEFGGVSNDERILAHCPAKHSHGVGRTGIIFQTFCNLKCDVGLDMPLGTLPFPN